MLCLYCCLHTTDLQYNICLVARLTDLQGLEVSQLDVCKVFKTMV